jgi:hypothetical protein
MASFGSEGEFKLRHYPVVAAGRWASMVMTTWRHQSRMAGATGSGRATATAAPMERAPGPFRRPGRDATACTSESRPAGFFDDAIEFRTRGIIGRDVTHALISAPADARRGCSRVIFAGARSR